MKIAYENNNLNFSPFVYSIYSTKTDNLLNRSEIHQKNLSANRIKFAEFDLFIFNYLYIKFPDSIG